MKKYKPIKITQYILKEFSISLLIIISIFLSLIFLTSYVEELFFLKQKNISENIFLKTSILTLMKMPNSFISISPYIFLITGVYFYVRLKRKNELSPLNIAGFSDNFISLLPAIYSFLLGVILITVFTPISSWLLKKYEIKKQQLENYDNIMIVNKTGLWIKEKVNLNTIIIRTDSIEDKNFSKVKNITVYFFENEISLKKIINAEKGIINNQGWDLINVKEIKNNETKKINEYFLHTKINLNELKNFFKNSSSYSIWNLLSTLNEIKEIGYYNQDILITFNKYLSLPIIFFCMIIFSTIFTLKNSKNYNNFIYSFLGIVFGILIHFLSDLSIAMGKSGSIPLVLSVWLPVIVLINISFYRLIKNNK